MIASFVVELDTLTRVRLRGSGGEALHGLFFQALRNYSEKLAGSVHDGRDKYRPFSLSGVLERKPRVCGKLVLEEGDPLSFRISVVDESLVPDVVAAFAKAAALRSELSLSDGRAVVRRFLFKEYASPLVRSALYPKLYEESTTSTVLNLRFLSPTSFRRKGGQVTLPEASLIFSSLLEKWNRFSHIRLEGGFLEGIKALYPSRFDLRSEIVLFSNYSIVGFKGAVQYRLGNHVAPEERKIINTLADYAFYAGVGYKTTMGMGQVVRVG